ncbi:MAG: MarR family transcriptional regulator [Proteobacteria bacterium]|nr:MarR family transcriptional regulator [Pseudomonadota bacterium]MDA1131802.1 MarR family transcriptional regulator [Pseudomonadota bacterium]
MATAEALDHVVRLVRDTFPRLQAAADRLHRHIGVTPAMRAVLEELLDGGPQTVPAIARSRSVSRQHIQSLADALAEAGLVHARPNPAHRRSPLLALSSRGRAVVAALRGAESPVLAELAAGFSADDIAATARTLSGLCAALDARRAAARRS